MSRILLKTEDHSRDSAGMRHVYPVISRRAGGVSVGINLNPNNACNWRCIYCQVPDLTRGGPPPLDLALLERELDGFLRAAVAGDFMATRVPAGSRRLVDLAFSGNGEPTSAREFPAAVEIAARVKAAHGLGRDVPLRLITNGSLLDRIAVQSGIAQLGGSGGEVWFKLDAGTAAGLARINGTRAQARGGRATPGVLRGTGADLGAELFLPDRRRGPGRARNSCLAGLLAPLAPKLAGVHLYSLARPSLQKEAPRLGRMDAAGLEALAARVRRLGLAVRVSP
jgi:hypothetical protein